MINNHKFFNFFLILGAMFSSYAVVWIMNGVARIGEPPGRGPLADILGGKRVTGPHLVITRIFQYIVGIACILMLTISGCIDLFPIINDSFGSIPDIAASADARWIAMHTNPGDIIANSTWFYHPASVAGRSVYSGYTYFTWSYGYDQVKREQVIKQIYEASGTATLCPILANEHISYVELSAQPESYLTPNLTLWHSLSPIYENPLTHRTIYKRSDICE